jgi:serine/threonine protein kinase
MEREGAKTCDEEEARAEKRSRLDVAESQAVSSSQVSSESAMVETSNLPVSLPSSPNQTLWLSHIKRLTDQGDTDTARAESYRFIQHDLPEGREIHFVQTAGGGRIPAIQLPLKLAKINRETGNETGFVQLKLLYVATGPHGLHLYGAEEFSTGNYLTNYDGKFLNDSSKVTNPTRVISLSYSMQWAVDGGGVDEWELVIKGSLGCMSNHSVDDSSVAKFALKGWHSPVSGHLESCWLVARKDGKKHMEITTHYTPGAADRHGIPPRGLVPGGNEIADEDMAQVPAVVRECMRKVQICCGYHLVRLQGSGAFGTAVMVRSGEEKFTIKFGTGRYDSGGRSVLVEASTMDIAERSKNGIFSLRLQRTGWPSGAALVTALGFRVAAVSMESADMDAHRIVDKLGERFREAAFDKELLSGTKGLSKAVLKTVMWMHEENLAHCDITPRNILLKKLSQRPEDERVAYFILGDDIWQAILADWGFSRWDGEFGGSRAVHRFSPSGKEHGHIPTLEGICNSTRFSEGVVPVGKKQLQVLFGTKTSKASDFRVPGRGTIMIRPPNQEDVVKFSSGEEQRKFDKAADVWAVGVLGARICAAPLVLSAPALAELKRSNEHEIWPENLRCFSQRASAAMASRLQGSKRAGNAMEKVGKASAGCCGLWLAEMVSQRYSDDTWPHLRRHMHGDDAGEWKEFLDLLQGLLAYPISDRLSAAEAVRHSSLSNIGSCPDVLSESDD